MLSIYFEVFEWTEAQALPPNYKCSGSKLPALQPIRYTPRFLFSRQALYSPFPRELVCTPHSTPATPIPTYTRIHALSSLSALRLSPCGAPRRPPRPSPRSLCLRSTWCPWKRILPPRPPPLSPPAPDLTREPRPRGPQLPPACSPRSDSGLARLGEEAPSWPRRPLHPPDWAGRRPRHTSPRALAQPKAGSGAAFPDPPLVSKAQRKTKGRAPGPMWLGRSWPTLLRDPNKARAAASRPRPGLPIGPRTLLAGGVILPQVQPVPLGHLRTLRAGGYERRRKKEAGGCIGTVEGSYLTLEDPHPSRYNSLHRAAGTRS